MTTYQLRLLRRAGDGSRWRATLAWMAAIVSGSIAILLMVGPRPASSLCLQPPVVRWPDERKAGHVILHADFSLEASQTWVEQLAAQHRDLQAALGIRPPREPIHVFLFHRSDTHREYLAAYYPSVPYRRAMYLKARGPGMVFAYAGEHLAEDVRHESVHAWLHADLPMVPLWLDEGLAEYFEVPPTERVAGHPHQLQVRRDLRWGRLTTLADLEQLELLHEMGVEEYRAAWAWVHFLLHHSQQTHGELLRYLDDIRRQVPPGRLSDRVQPWVPHLDAAIEQHFR